MEKQKEIRDYSHLIEAETEVFSKNIDILRGWRETIWDSVFKRTSAFLVPYLDGLFEMQEELVNFKQYAPNEVHENFLKEYNMTMLLLQKSLIKSCNENLLPHTEEDQIKVKELISKIGTYQQDKDLEEVIALLRNEDPSVKKALEDLGLPQEKIEEIIASGYNVESVLDIEPIFEKMK